MSDLISKGAIYKKIAEMEDLARKRVLDMPTNSPCYMIYVAQLNERTALKHVIADAPTIEAEPVVHGRWIFGNANHREYMKCSECLHSQTPTGVFVYCPNCGAKMIGGIDHDSGKSN